MWEGLPKEEFQESRHSGATWETDRGDLPFSSSQILLERRFPIREDPLGNLHAPTHVGLPTLQ